MKSIFKKKTSGINVFSSFEGTDHSERLENTFNEVQTFKRQLLKAEAALRTFAKATDEVLKTADDSLSAFPRVWRQGDAAPNSAQLAQEDVVKAAPTSKKLGAYPSERITSAMDSKLQDEVYTPIERWHKQYQQLKTRITAVENTRVEYDAARKEVADTRNAQLKHVRKTDGKNDPALDVAEANARKVLAAKREAYIGIEEDVHAELVSLAADAQAALGNVRRALRLEAEALLAAEEQLGSLETDMPVISRERDGPMLLPGDFESPAATPTGTPTAAGAVASPTGTPTAAGTTAAGATAAAAGAAGPRAKKPTGYGNTFQYWDEEGNAIAPPQGVKAAEGAGAETRPPAIQAVPTGQFAKTGINDGAAARQPGRVQDSVTELPSAPTHPVEQRRAAAAAAGQPMPAS